MKDMIIVRGAGDLATGIIHKLYNSGFNVLVLEIEEPTAIRRKVTFSEAIFNKTAEVENVIGTFCKNRNEIIEAFKSGIAVVVDPKMKYLEEMQPIVLIDATIQKKNVGININLAKIVIGIGPGFVANKDVHAVVETNRGHDLGRIYYQGKAKENTGNPGYIMNYSMERVLKAPCEGRIVNCKNIGYMCKAGDLIATVHGIQIFTKIDGIIRGMIRNGTYVYNGMKIADIDPRIEEKANCNKISDKARCIAGGVLETILHLKMIKNI